MTTGQPQTRRSTRILDLCACAGSCSLSTVEQTARTCFCAFLQARTLGPWSSARQLAEGRGAAAAAREAKILESARVAKAAAADAAALAWQPRRDVTLGPRPGVRVASLVALCVDLVVVHLEDVDTLWGMPDMIKVHIQARWSARS